MSDQRSMEGDREAWASVPASVVSKSSCPPRPAWRAPVITRLSLDETLSFPGSATDGGTHTGPQ